MEKNAANSNVAAATAGGMFYPEMGERHDGSALFVASYCGNVVGIEWRPERDAEARAAFKALRIRPSGIEYVDSARLIAGARPKWAACVTYAAHRKLMGAKLSVVEAML